MSWSGDTTAGSGDHEFVSTQTPDSNAPLQTEKDAIRDARLDNLIEREQRRSEVCLDCQVGHLHLCPDLPIPANRRDVR